MNHACRLAVVIAPYTLSSLASAKREPKDLPPQLPVILSERNARVEGSMHLFLYCHPDAAFGWSRPLGLQNSAPFIAALAAEVPSAKREPKDLLP
jgi:hypothetical protein